ncbi:MAG: hypothetical protein ACFCUE_15285 [Candidatus Bathyarchaeia archaeon]|jgi:hypothetical protein
MISQKHTKTVNILLIFSLILSIAILISYVASSQRIDEPGTELIFENLSSVYWVGLGLLALSIFLFSISDLHNALLNFTLLFGAASYMDTFFAFLYTNPIFREIYHAGQWSYILKYSNFNLPLYTGSVETVAPSIDTATLSMISSIKMEFIIPYFPFFEFLLTVLFTYILLKKLCNNNKVNVIGTLLVSSLLLSQFGAYRGSFSTPFFILGVYALLLVFENNTRRSGSLMLFMIYTVLVLTHPGISLIFLGIAILSVLLFSVAKKEKMSQLKTFPVLLLTVYFSWFSFRYFVPVTSGIHRAISSVSELLVESPQTYIFAKSLTYTEEYSIIWQLRLFETFFIVAFAWLMLLIALKQGKNFLINPKSAVITAGLFVITVASIPTLYIGWPIGMISLLLPWAGLAIAFIIGKYLCRNTVRLTSNLILKFLLVGLVIFCVMLTPLTKWGSVSTLVQVPTREISMIGFVANFEPVNNSSGKLGGVGVGHGGGGPGMTDAIRYIYADRLDLYIDSIGNRVAFSNLTEAINFISSYDTLLFSRYILTFNSKYDTDTPIEDQISAVQHAIEEENHYNRVYSNDWLYFIEVQ